MGDDDLHAAMRFHRLEPAFDARVELAGEALAVRFEIGAIGWVEARQRFEHRCGDRPSVFRIEPIVRVAEPVEVSALVRPEARRFGLEQLDAA